MRRAAVVGVVCALGLGGCGGEREVAGPRPLPKGDFGPARPGSGTRSRPEAPPARRPSSVVAAALAAGTVAVMGADGAIGVRPARLGVSADGTLSGLRWSRWGSSAAHGEGKLRVLDCDPTCASGGERVLDATIRLSAPRLCGRAAYFDRAVVSAAGQSPPASYVRAPC